MKKVIPDAEFILVTGHATLETAIEAVNQGAFAYHVKPLEIDALKSSVRNALRQQLLEIEKRNLLEKIQGINAQLEQSVAELERKNQALHKALAEVKLLSGLLPICASCKKIQNDAGYWNEIEGSIAQHSEARFSHGICPECIKQLYPDLYQQLNPHGAKSGVSDD